MIELKEILAMPKEHRQVLQEVIGYSIACDMNLSVFSPAQKKMITERMVNYCNKKDALFKYDDLKVLVLDKLK